VRRIVLTITATVLALSLTVNAGTNSKNSTGTVSGQITFSGQFSAPKKLTVTKDKKICGRASHVDESMLVNEKNKGLKNTVVYLEQVNSGKAWPAPAEGLVLDQKGCHFSPHVIVVPAGQTLTVLNPDGILHNIHTHSELNKPINKAQPKFKKKMKLSFDKPEIVKVSCDVHNWMGGWIVVADHPYYAVTDENGAFKLQDVPAGTYTLKIWHEKLGEKSTTIEVKSGETARVEEVF